MKKQILGIGCLVLLGLLSACSNTQYSRPIAPAPQVTVNTSGIDGKWNHTKGIFVANFNGGKFRSIATDTGKPVAIGQYKQVDSQNVQLEWYGGASQSVRKANCNLVSPDYMRCMQTNGSSFEMQKSAV